jgi:hypothetical protein
MFDHVFVISDKFVLQVFYHVAYQVYYDVLNICFDDLFTRLLLNDYWPCFFMVVDHLFDDSWQLILMIVDYVFTVVCEHVLLMLF